MNKLKKLTIKKEVIARINDNQMNQLWGRGDMCKDTVPTTLQLGCTLGASCFNNTCGGDTCLGTACGTVCTVCSQCGCGSGASVCNCTDSNLIICTNYGGNGGGTGYAGCLNWTQGFFCLY